jgi:Sulfotransferase family
MPFKGFLEAVEPFQVRGWAFDTACPDKPLTVEVLLRGETLGTTVANLYRVDLEKDDLGKGEYAFIFNFVKKLSDDDLNDISARIVHQDGVREQLPALPEAAQARPEPKFSRTPVEFRGNKSDEQPAPIFVLGTARSGTSAITQALLKLFPGHMEGHFIDLLAHLSVATNKFYRYKGDELAIDKNTMVSNVPRDYVQDHLDAMFLAMMDDLFPASRWVEKTPNSDMIHLAPRLKEIWPNSRFIFMKRRFLENLQSRLRKFPKYDFVQNGSEWALAMAAWLGARPQLAGNAIEIDQHYLSTEPEAVASALGEFLDLTELQAKRLGQALKNDRPERTSELSDQLFDLESLRWTEPQIEEFERTCLKWMDAFGYSTDKAYFKPGNEGQKLVFI